MKEKLSRIRSPWRRLLISLVINCLLLLDQVRVRSPRSKVHWIGARQRPRRLERAFFIAVVFIAMITFEPREYVIWSLAWGSATSLFVIIHTLYKLAQRKSYPSINSDFQ